MSREIEFPEALEFLRTPARYKVLYGGRGGLKSWGIARHLLVEGVEQKLFNLCLREFQRSIAESVHRLLANQIQLMGFSDFYEVQDQRIVGKNQTEFVFAGLRHNINSIKSIEGVDRAYVEEAQTVTKASWNVLLPTIRKPGSEILIAFNPELETDETYQRFVVNPPPDAIVRKVGWEDNPWFSDVLRAEKDHLERTDPDSALVVWGGHTRQVLDGAVYANEIRAATAENRITRVPYDPSKPVHTFWDLGWADSTCIWFAQTVGFETRVIDFYQGQQLPLSHYLEAIQSRGYVLGTCWLPHDARARQLGTGRSVEELTREAGRTVRIVPSLSLEDGINATRTMFPNMWFDADKCADGLNALRRYRYEVSPSSGSFSRKPLHDDASHGADAARYMSIALKEPRKPVVAQRLIRSAASNGLSWMGA